MKKLGLVAALSLVACGRSVKTVDVKPATLIFNRVGATASISASALDAEAKPLPDAHIAFASSDPAVATVDDKGLVTALKSGTATVSATSGTVAGKSIAKVQIPKEIKVFPAALSLVGIGQSGGVVATLLDENQQPVEGAKLTWETQSPAVASVDNGAVTAVGVGEGTVSVSVEGLKVEAKVKVEQPPFEKMAVDPATAQLRVGANFKVTPKATDAAGNTVAGVGFTYSSSDAKVATVDASGVITAVAAGKAKITAAAGERKGLLELTVKKK